MCMCVRTFWEEKAQIQSYQRHSLTNGKCKKRIQETKWENCILVYKGRLNYHEIVYNLG